MNTKPIWFFLAALLVVGGTVACDKTSPPVDGTEVEWEIEDCDAEDLRNREAECASRLRTKAPTRVDTRKPVNTRTTRRR